MSDKIARLKAQLELAELEAEFVAKKAAGKLTYEDKVALREARQAYRENVRQPVQDGAAPAAIGASAEVN